MALFKTFRGKRADLGAQELRDGFAYFCTDDGTFHIDFLDTDGTVKRKQINAKDAETLLGHSIEEFLTASENGSFAHGEGAAATGTNSYAGGQEVLAFGNAAHVEGKGARVGDYSIEVLGQQISLATLNLTIASADATNRTVTTSTTVIPKENLASLLSQLSTGRLVIKLAPSGTENYIYLPLDGYTIEVKDGFLVDSTYLVLNVSDAYDETVNPSLANLVGYGLKDMCLGVAYGEAAHIEGYGNITYANYAHVEGKLTVAEGEASHTEGTRTIASGEAAHAEGASTRALGNYTHAEGHGTKATAEDSHAEGIGAIASGVGSHAEGYYTEASHEYAHVEGRAAVASGKISHAEGHATVASGSVSHAEGNTTTASGSNSHAEGSNTFAEGEAAHAEGVGSQATAKGAHAEGENTTASANRAHAEGYGTSAGELNAHAEGKLTTASAEEAHAEGISTIASGAYSHTEGNTTQALSEAAHAEGKETIAQGIGAHAEGSKSRALNNTAHAEGSNTEASGDKSHAEGNSTKATGTASHAEGDKTEAKGYASHAGGQNSIASNAGSFVHGTGLKTNSNNQFVVGVYNKTFNDAGAAVFIVGNGKEDARSNALAVMKNGDAYLKGDLYVGGLPEGDEGTGIAKVATEDEAHSYTDAAVKNKADKHNTVITGSLSMGRDSSSTIGAESFAMGSGTVASGKFSYAGGYGTQATARGAHAEGSDTHAWADYAHAEGSGNFAKGIASHTEGIATVAEGIASHAGGASTKTTADHAFAHGNNLIASAENQFVIGQYNKEDPDAVFIIGGGEYENEKNIFTIKKNGEMIATPPKGQESANALKETVSGEYLAINNFSPIACGMDLQVSSNGANEVTVRQFGKNIINTDNFLGDALTKDDDGVYTFACTSTYVSPWYRMHIPANTPLTISFEGLEIANISDNCLRIQIQTDGGNHWISIPVTPGEGRSSKTITTKGNVAQMQIFIDSSNGRSAYVKFKKPQFEINTVATEYEPYKEVVIHTPKDDGKIIDVTPFYPVTTLLTNVIGATIDCTYSKDVNTIFEGDGVANPVLNGSFSMNRLKGTGIGEYSSTLGYGNKAEGKYSHAEGSDTIASGIGSHAEGTVTRARGNYSHAEGLSAVAEKEYSHAGGCITQAKGVGSFVHGYWASADADYQTTLGICNEVNSAAAFIVANGEASNQYQRRSNAFEVNKDGNTYVQQNLFVGGTGANQSIAKEVATKDDVEVAKFDVKNELLNGAGDAYDTLKELGELINANATALGALREVATNKADKVHNHNDSYYTKNEVDEKISASSSWTEEQKEEIKAYVREYINQVILGGEW